MFLFARKIIVAFTPPKQMQNFLVWSTTNAYYLIDKYICIHESDILGILAMFVLLFIHTNSVTNEQGEPTAS